MYCSDRCRKAAKRAIAKGAGLRTKAVGNPGQLGKEPTEFPGGQTASPRDLAARARKTRRYQGRRTLWRISGDPKCRGCGRQLMDPASGVIVAQTAEGNSVVLGLMKCARIWLCPVCSATIRHQRAQEITRVVVDWIRRGGIAVLVTFTARHAHTHQLADLMDAIQGSRKASAADVRAAETRLVAALAAYDDAVRLAKFTIAAASRDAGKGLKRKAAAAAKEDVASDVFAAWNGVLDAKAALRKTGRTAGAYQRLISGGTWAGRPDRNETGIRDRVGYLGMIRATEITLGLANGWHPHIHAIVLLGGTTEGEKADKKITGVFTPSDSAIAEFEGHFRSVWTTHLKRINPEYTPSDEHGVDFKRLKTERDAQDLGQYIAKLQDGDKTVSPANEVARGDLKEGRYGNMTPFQLLGRIGDIIGGMPEEDAEGDGPLEWCLGSWHEYERAVRGRRAIEWTRYLRSMFGIEGGDTEEDDLDALFAADGANEYRAGIRVQDETWGKVTGRALDLAAVQAVEGTKGIDMEKVAEVVAAAGAALDTVALLTPAEIAEAYAGILETLAQRREEAAARRRREDEKHDQEDDVEGSEPVDTKAREKAQQERLLRRHTRRGVPAAR
ncbi:hypothetical protein [Pseudonocardia alni]|uniref:hypothetical protein n=1 Tax=Pseudonocardia alni TaxID=33907 RepID=UPI003329644E